MLVSDYIKEVELARNSNEREIRAREKEAFGDVNVKGVAAVLAMLAKEGQLAMYYSGGLRLLADDMRHNSETSTIFTFDISKHCLVNCTVCVGRRKSCCVSNERRSENNRRTLSRCKVRT